MSQMAASRARTASRLLLQAQARTKMKHTESPSAASGVYMLPHVSREPLDAVRRAIPGLRDLYANLLARSSSSSLIVDIRRLYEPTQQTDGARGYLHTIEHTLLEAQHRGLLTWAVRVLQAAASKTAIRERNAPSLRCCRYPSEGACSVLRLAGAGCWRGGPRTP